MHKLTEKHTTKNCLSRISNSRIHNLRVHDLTLLILAFIYLISILINPSWYLNWYIVLLSGVNVYLFTGFNKSNLKLVLIVIGSLIPIALATFCTSILFRPHNLNLQTTYMLGLQLVSRIYVLVIAPLLVFSVIDFEHLILYAMQYLRLPVMLGYPLLSAVGAIKHFTTEFKRIREAYLMRYASRRFNLLMIYPLLVSAARYAFHQGVSMESRGLNANKTFLHQVLTWRRIDTIVICINISILLWVLT